ncbi:MAG: ZIP family metal transporter [Candidatus Bathyarchaeota archaeon]|nr:MAG: ZIP family metal transporter [Candidatus Bathyarchaeota archaeon]
MVSNQLTILLATIVVSLFSLSGILALSIRDDTLHRVLFFLIAFSAGSILGASLFDLLPEAIELVEETIVFIYIALGFIAFYFLERFIYWYHGHGHHADIEAIEEERAATKGFAYLNILGDGIHNFIDGMIIAASFTVGFPVGLASTVAVIFHELPQEMGDYGVLIYAGFEKGRALILNFIVALSVVFGGVFGILFLKTVDALSGFLISFSAGAFIYLSASELIPELQEEEDFGRSLIQFIVFLLGLALIWSLGIIFPE